MRFWDRTEKRLNRTGGYGIFKMSASMSSRFTARVALSIWHTQSTAAIGDGQERLEDEVVALFDQLRKPLLRYLSDIGLGFPDGEEVIQEVFLSLFQHLNSGKSRENLRGWLFRVAHNQGLRWRYRVRREWEARTAARIEDTAIDAGPSPEAQVAHTQTQQRLLAVVKALPETDRRCLLLRAEGLRYREIAAILDISLGSVSTSLVRTLARMARAAEQGTP
jgi:RNA polymerase sigma-70 factor (ECF subfamily)